MSYPFRHAEEYHIQDGCEFIDKGVFLSCTGLTRIDIPEGVKEIGDRAFERCASLQSINLPITVKKIGIQAFQNCTGLTTLLIPEGIEEIPENAISFCSKLSTLYLPNSLKHIGKEALFTNASLKDVYLMSKEPPTAKDEDFFIFYPGSGVIPAEGRTLYIPTGTKDTYQKAEGWRQFSIIKELEIFPNSTETISLTDYSVLINNNTLTIKFCDSSAHHIVVFNSNGQIIKECDIVDEESFNYEAQGSPSFIIMQIDRKYTNKIMF